MTTSGAEGPDPYAVELALAAALAAEITDPQAEAIIRAWAAAWAEVASDLQDALEVILAAGDAVNAMAVVRYQRLARVLAAIADKLEDLVGDLGVQLTGDLVEVLDMATTGSLQLIGAQLPFDFDLPDRPVAPDALQAIIDRVTEQVTSTALPLADETYAIILRELTRGVAAGDNPRETARRMVERTENHWNFGRARAENIARTETLDAYREAARIQQDQHADILAGWVWLAHLGPRTCRSCLAMHGQVFSLDEPGPHDHPQGRCSRCPVVREEDGTVDLSWVPSADEHFESLTRDEQRKLLGRQGYQAWVAGEFPREQWTKTRPGNGWRESQNVASPGDPDAGVPPGGGEPPELPPVIPWDDDDGDLPEISEADLDKIITGHLGMNNVWHGGHAPGAGRDKKTEFPARWPWIRRDGTMDRDYLRAAINQAMRAAHWRFHSGDRHRARIFIGGLVLEVSWYYLGNDLTLPIFRAAYPVNGHGVVLNVDGSPIRVPLDLGAIGV